MDDGGPPTIHGRCFVTKLTGVIPTSFRGNPAEKLVNHVHVSVKFGGIRCSFKDEYMWFGERKDYCHFWDFHQAVEKFKSFGTLRGSS